MSDKQFTFFELHVHDGLQIGPRSLGDAEELPGSGDGTGTAGGEASAAESAEGEAASGPSVLGPLLGLGALAGLAYAVKKLLAGADPEGLEALDDIEAEAEAGDDLDAEDAVPIEITSPEEEGEGGLAALLVGAVLLLALFAVAVKKLLGGEETVVVED